MWMPDSSGSENLLKLDIAAHEWLALVYYKEATRMNGLRVLRPSSGLSEHRELVTSGPS